MHISPFFICQELVPQPLYQDDIETIDGSHYVVPAGDLRSPGAEGPLITANPTYIYVGIRYPETSPPFNYRFSREPVFALYDDAFSFANPENPVCVFGPSVRAFGKSKSFVSFLSAVNPRQPYQRQCISVPSLLLSPLRFSNLFTPIILTLLFPVPILSMLLSIIFICSPMNIMLLMTSARLRLLIYYLFFKKKPENIPILLTVINTLVYLHLFSFKTPIIDAKK